MQFSVTPREALGLEDLPLLNSLGFDYNAPHVVYPPAGSTNVLAVCVFGTGTRPDQSSIYLRHLHELTGLPTIGLSYKFGPIPDVKRNKRIEDLVGGDEAEMQKRIEAYHEDILYGGSTCGLDFIDVSKEDSIVSRLSALLSYLDRTRPSEEGWGCFLEESSGVLDYSKMMFTGYSQGAGHLCYLAKTNVLGGLIMVSGPQDAVPSRGSGVTSWMERDPPFATRNMVAWKHAREETGGVMDQCWRIIEPLALGRVNDSQCSVLYKVDGGAAQMSVRLETLGDRCFHVGLDPQAGFTANDRPCHCSTLIDAATPLTTDGMSVYEHSIYPHTIKLCIAGISTRNETHSVGYSEASKL